MREGAGCNAKAVFLRLGPRAFRFHQYLLQPIAFTAIVFLIQAHGVFAFSASPSLLTGFTSQDADEADGRETSSDAAGGDEFHSAARNEIAPPHDRQLTDAATIRASLGYRLGQNGYDLRADINSDGMVNAQDVALFHLAERDGSLPIQTCAMAKAIAGTERIIVKPSSTTALPGQTVSVLFLLRDNSTPLTSYTVDTNVVANLGAVGTITANVGLTNFFDRQNFITAGGATRDPLFSVITGNGTGGVSITTITDDFSTVLATDDVNDVLAQVFFDVPLDALGDFTIQHNPTSALIDAIGTSVTFTLTAGTIRVLDPATIPTVSEWGMIAMCILLVTTGSVVFVGRGRKIRLDG